MDEKLIKKEKNRANYERNRERIKARNLERYHAQKHLKVSGNAVPAGNDFLTSVEKIQVPGRRHLEKPARNAPKLRLLSAEPATDLNKKPYEDEKKPASLVTEYESAAHGGLIGCPVPSGQDLESGSGQNHFHQHRHFQPESGSVDLKKPGFSSPVPGASGKTLRVAVIFFRVALALSLCLLEIFMLKSFFDANEVLQSHTLELAVCAVLSLQALVMMTFDGFLRNQVRRFIVGIFFCWMIVSQGYSLFYQARSKLETIAPSSRLTDLKKREADARSDLEWAKRTKSWQDVKTFSEDLRATQAAIDALPRTEVLGVTNDRAVGMGAALAIVLRALLLAVSVLNAAKIRESLTC
ncbi:MAG TPA: hypothetical protein VFO10_02820 [Oligoflexus sp.]|uniref:hypothetical protein n=1 Tax=Oligoflexus sp. TaxID=1971216 RepID=UPI002D7FC8B5|nr:hypothetical protein [Oligoflexus sp.]HET9236155.1 hypothetical protein [Oligoflexus sp.]